MSVRRPCIGCGLAYAGNGSCPSCGRARIKPKASPSKRGYDRQYYADCHGLLAERPYCELRLPGCTIVADTCDHVDPLGAGGDRRGELRPACRHCNSSRGAKVG